MITTDSSIPFEPTLSLTEDGFWFYDWVDVSDKAVEKFNASLAKNEYFTEQQKLLVTSGFTMAIALVPRCFHEVADEIQAKLEAQVQSVLEEGEPYNGEDSVRNRNR